MIPPCLVFNLLMLVHLQSPLNHPFASMYLICKQSETLLSSIGFYHLPEGVILLLQVPVLIVKSYRFTEQNSLSHYATRDQPR